MFCYQCEQTAKQTGCTSWGVCGKAPEASDLMDLLIHGVKGLSMYADRARKLGATDPEINSFTAAALFTTLTNVDFDPNRVGLYVYRAAALRDRARTMYEDAARKAGITPEQLGEPATFQPSLDKNELLRQAESVTIEKRKDAFGDDVAGLQELVTYGIKGASAYAYHAHELGRDDDAVYGMFHDLLNRLAEEPRDLGELLGLALKAGELNFKAMELLDAANTGVYGNPEPTPVRITPVKGKCILVSGHDLRDLDDILKQAEGKGINVYTHSEMLPCHGYPGLKKYKHLVGNYGGAWQDQRDEFEKFPGAIVMTTNCLQKPKDSYKDRIFTVGVVGWADVTHIADRDYTPAIKAALAAPGFAETEQPEKTILVGFGHNAVLNAAPKVIELVKAGKIRHFFLVGGCDGAKLGRNYYTEFAEKVPQDCVILTLACGKYRFNKMEFGAIDGIPRLLDVGQCNDSYSAVRIAVALAEAFNTDVNGLPLSLVLSWYEQKAVAILLTLLSLGVRNIRLGPTLPAFLTPAVLNVLVEKFNIMPITTPEADLAAILEPAA